MDKCTDENLREQLKVYGQDVGPINNSTRPYWQKALTKLMLQHGVSPIKCALEKKRARKETPLNHKKRKNTTCRSQSVDSPKYADQYFSESDLSDWENDSIVTDSPGSTPFPAKVSRNKKSCSNQRISSIEAPDRSEGITKHTPNRKNYISMASNSARKIQEINIDNTSTRIQKRDRNLREKLKEFGEHVELGPMNESTRTEWKKRLDKLMSGLSPLGSYSDSEIMNPLSYGCRMRRKPRKETFDIRNIHDEENEDLDYSMNEYECCSENVHTSKQHLSECLKFFFKVLMKGTFFVIVVILVVLLVGPTDLPEEDEYLEADV